MRVYLGCMHAPACGGMRASVACVLPSYNMHSAPAWIHACLRMPNVASYCSQKTLVVAGTCGHVTACGLLGGCAQAPLNMWMRTSTVRYTTKAGRWLVSVTFMCLLVIAFSVILSPFTLPIPSPTTIGPNIPRVLFPRPRTLEGIPPPSIMDARWRHLRLAVSSADSVFRAHRYPHYAPPRLHAWPCTLTTPLHATTHHSNLLPAHTPVPHSHLYFGYKVPFLGVSLGLTSVHTKDRATLHMHSTHSINTRKHPTPTPHGKVYKWALVVPPSSPH